MERVLAIMIGIQGSGKSTFYHNFLSKDFVRINLDTLKTRHREKLLIEECIADGKSFAIDNTNPTKEDRQRYIPLAKAAGYKTIGYFMESKLKNALSVMICDKEKRKYQPSLSFLPQTNCKCPRMMKDLMNYIL